MKDNECGQHRVLIYVKASLANLRCTVAGRRFQLLEGTMPDVDLRESGGSQVPSTDKDGDTGDQPTENELTHAVDEQTGKRFKIVTETTFDSFMANLSALYQLFALAFLLWLLFDTWSGRNLLLQGMGYAQDIFTSRTFRLMAFVAIAGGIGGAVSGIRSIISWHSERRAYGANFIWKDLSLPLMGAALGLIVYVAVRGGVGLLDGDFSLDSKGSTPAVTAFAIAWIAGFASWQVFRWLDAQANKLFNVKPVPKSPDKTVDGRKRTLGATSESGALKSSERKQASRQEERAEDEVWVMTQID